MMDNNYHSPITQLLQALFHYALSKNCSRALHTLAHTIVDLQPENYNPRQAEFPPPLVAEDCPLIYHEGRAKVIPIGFDENSYRAYLTDSSTTSLPTLLLAAEMEKLQHNFDLHSIPDSAIEAFYACQDLSVVEEADINHLVIAYELGDAGELTETWDMIVTQANHLCEDVLLEEEEDRCHLITLQTNPDPDFKEIHQAELF
ncbi:hypothetical protein C8R43DRAFT_1138011 [Mycena crocata]|nr:hypothetical protein C8R43DRAFT_1138011 [Mycena crocata]